MLQFIIENASFICILLAVQGILILFLFVHNIIQHNENKKFVSEIRYQTSASEGHREKYLAALELEAKVRKQLKQTEARLAAYTELSEEQFYNLLEVLSIADEDSPYITWDENRHLMNTFRIMNTFRTVVGHGDIEQHREILELSFNYLIDKIEKANHLQAKD